MRKIPTLVLYIHFSAMDVKKLTIIPGFEGSRQLTKADPMLALVTPLARSRRWMANIGPRSSTQWVSRFLDQKLQKSPWEMNQISTGGY
jgi:hypothetical protein